MFACVESDPETLALEREREQGDARSRELCLERLRMKEPERKPVRIEAVLEWEI